MSSIVAYQKHITTEITRELLRPVDAEHHHLGTELATIDGTTYVSLPDGAVLPKDQPAEIKKSIKTVTLTDELRSQIKAASPHVRLINAQVSEQIRERYSITDELKMLRLAPSMESSAYNDYAEACRAWGRGKKADLGL